VAGRGSSSSCPPCPMSADRDVAQRPAGLGRGGRPAAGPSHPDSQARSRAIPPLGPDHSPGLAKGRVERPRAVRGGDRFAAFSGSDPQPRCGPRQSLHASCIVIGESGILIRGASGAGKSSLAASLVSRARERGTFAAWVADDRVIVTAYRGRLIAAPHPLIAGRFEARGLGILREPHEPRAVLRLLVDLKDNIERLPVDSDLEALVADVAVQRLPLVAGRVGLYETSLVFRLAHDPGGMSSFPE
jgi:HPr kinase/phosphorylase